MSFDWQAEAQRCNCCHKHKAVEELDEHGDCIDCKDLKDACVWKDQMAYELDTFLDTHDM